MDTSGQVDGGSTSSNLFLSELREKRQKVHRFKEWFRHSYESRAPWTERAIESFRFVANEQWDEADLSMLREQRRPALTINKILAPVLFMGGVQRQQRTETKVIGFEPGDAENAELMQGLVKWVETQSRLPEEDSRVFLDKVITGLGFWKVNVDFDENPEGDITVGRLSPLAVFTDPNWFDNGWKASRYVMHALWRELEELVAEYPEHEETIRSQYGEWLGAGTGDGFGTRIAPAQSSGEELGDSFSSRRMFWDAETQRARVLEIWYSERINTKVAYDTATGTVLDDEEDVAMAEQALQIQPELQQRLQVLTRPVKRIRVAKLLGDVLLCDDPSPFDEPQFPIFPAVGHLFWGHPFGMVEPMKDPQREINRRRSSVIEIVRRMPHAGWLNRKSGGAKTEDLEKFAQGSGFVINFESEPPQQAKAPDLPQTLVYLERANADEVRSIVNINAEMTGMTTQRTVSGRAIEARQRGGLTVQEPLLESFDHEKENLTLFLIPVIQQYISVPRGVRILGALAQRMPMNPAAQMGQQQEPIALAAALSRAFDTKFDVVVKSQPWHPSIQAEKWDTLVELAQNFGSAIPPEVMVEAARDAGVIDEGSAQKILANVQQQQAAQQQQEQAAANGMAAAAGGAPPGPPTLQ